MDDKKPAARFPGRGNRSGILGLKGPTPLLSLSLCALCQVLPRRRHCARGGAFPDIAGSVLTAHFEYTHTVKYSHAGGTVRTQGQKNSPRTVSRRGAIRKFLFWRLPIFCGTCQTDARHQPEQRALGERPRAVRASRDSSPFHWTMSVQDEHGTELFSLTMSDFGDGDPEQ
jgi:hypothetical protein